jgi:hypothetical protein
MGGTVIIHSARPAAAGRSAGASLLRLCLHHGLLGNETGCEIAP